MADTTGSPMPNFQTMRDNAQTAYDQARNRLAEQRAELYSQYGFNDDGTLNTANPYGVVMQERQQTGQALLGDMQSQASRGIGTGGLAKQRSQLMRFMHGKNVADYTNRFANASTGINQGYDAAALQNKTANDDIDSQQAQWVYFNTLLNPPPAADTGAAQDTPPGYRFVPGPRGGYVPPGGGGRFVID